HWDKSKPVRRPKPERPTLRGPSKGIHHTCCSGYTDSDAESSHSTSRPKVCGMASIRSGRSLPKAAEAAVRGSPPDEDTGTWLEAQSDPRLAPRELDIGAPPGCNKAPVRHKKSATPARFHRGA